MRSRISGDGDERQPLGTDAHLPDLDLDPARSRRPRHAIERPLLEWAATDGPVVGDTEDDEPSVGHGHRRYDLVEPARSLLELDTLVLESSDQPPQIILGQLVGDRRQPGDLAGHKDKILKCLGDNASE